MPDDDTRNFETISLTGYKERRVVVDVLYEAVDERRSVRVTASPNRLKVFLEYEIRSGANPTVGNLITILEEDVGIQEGLDVDGLSYIIRLFDHGGLVKIGPIEIACGVPPKKGRDGRIDFLVNPSSKKARYNKGADGKIDYHETNLIENVYEGRDIAIIRQPTKGVPGKDVFGKRIPAPPGSPMSVRIGANVKFDEATGYCKSLIDGRVTYNNKVIAVVDNYVIDNDVDLSIGNIDFVGDVVVNGSVLDDFIVKGRKSVTINGIVGACEVWSEGNIHIYGGVAGKGKAFLRSEEGIVSAKYINESHIEAKGGVYAKNEIVNSRVSTSGSVFVESGAIIGGEVTSLKGVEAQVFGSELGVATRVNTGLDWAAQSEINELVDKIKGIEEYIKEASFQVETILHSEDFNSNILGEDERALLDRTHKMLLELSEFQQKYYDRIEGIGSQHYEGAVYQVNVGKKMYQGITVQLGPLIQKITNGETGPATITCDNAEEHLKVLPYRKLAVYPLLKKKKKLSDLEDEAEDQYGEVDA